LRLPSIIACDPPSLQLRELGVTGHPTYKITATMDFTAMVTVHTQQHGVYECKPLQVLWSRFPDTYTPANTIMFDDLLRNYVCNPQNGLVIRPFRKAATRGKGDRELEGLEEYLCAIAGMDSLEGLNHDRWERFLDKRRRTAG
jgi:ubiquitin-like domain-containing CTD phosphatase 1